MLLPLLELPTDYPRPAAQSFRGAAVSIELSAELTTAEFKQRVPQRTRMTSFMLLLSAFSLLLSRHSRQRRDQHRNTNGGGAHRLETESLIGFFVNTLVLRTEIKPEQGRSVRELWSQVKEVILQAHAHQDVPFEKLVEELEPERSLSYSPLFQVMFTMQNTAQEDGGVRRSEACWNEHRSAKRRSLI
jgi:non-ribosomal peptide synthetase component F